MASAIEWPGGGKPGPRVEIEEDGGASDLDLDWLNEPHADSTFPLAMSLPPGKLHHAKCLGEFSIGVNIVSGQHRAMCVAVEEPPGSLRRWPCCSTNASDSHWCRR